MTKFRIHPTVLILLIFPVTGLLSIEQTVLLWVCAAAHEAGHAGAYRICGSRLESVTVLPFGLCAVPQDPLRLSPGNEVFCAAAGPTVNLLFSAVFLALPLPAEIEELRYFLYCNVALFAVNVLPVLPLDGGRILYYALAGRFNAAVCEKICFTVGWVVLVLLFYPAVLALIRDKNPSLAMIWGYLGVYTVLRRGSI